MEVGRVASVRIFHYGDDLPEHDYPHDEGLSSPYDSLDDSVMSLPFQYYGASEIYERILRYMNVTLTAVFTVEAILKILALGVRVSLRPFSG